MYTRNIWVTASLLALASLTQCTPPQSPMASTQWVVANQTPDTLWVAVRYPRDSVALTTAEVIATRHQLLADSVDLAHQNGFYQPPWLQHFTCHKGQWYLVQNTTANIVYHADHDPSPTQAPQVNRARGVLTYRVPPHRTQQLVSTNTTPTVAQSEPLITELYLREGRALQTVLPGPPLLEVFRPQPTGQEHDYSPRYRCQLTVGSGLTINK